MGQVLKWLGSDQHWTIVFLWLKGTKMSDPILESSLKIKLNTIYCDIFCC